MRGAISVTLQPHQILRLSRKMTCTLDPHHIWNVIYNARSNRCHLPTSPNIAPATQNDRPKSDRNLLKTGETSFTLRGRSEHDPSMIRAWTRRPATRRATEVTFRARHKHFVLKHATFRAPASFPNFARCCTCHEKWHLNFTKYCACHEKWHLNFTKYCACHQKWLLSFTKYCACHEKSCLNLTKYCACHEKFLLLCLYYYLTIPIPIAWLYYSLQIPTTWALLLLDDSYYLTLLLRDDSYDLTLLLHDSDSYYLTLLLLADSYNLTLLVLDSYYSTLLLLDDFYYLTLLLRDDSFYLTLLLDSAMSFVYRKFLNLNFLWWYTLGPMQAALCRYMIHAFCESSF